MKEKRIILFIIVLIVSVSVGGILELTFNYKTIQNQDFQIVEIDKENIINLENFSILDEGKYQSKSASTLRINLNGSFVGKLEFSYISEHPLSCEIVCVSENSEGRKIETTFEEKNSSTISKSITNLNQKVDYIELKFPEDSHSVTLYDFKIDNNLHLSRIRFIYISLVTLVILLACFHKHVYFRCFFQKIEVFFLVFSLLAGSLFIVTLSPHRVGWDDEIHLKNAYALSYVMMGNSDVYMSDAAKIQANLKSNQQNWPSEIYSSNEEYHLEQNYWDSINNAESISPVEVDRVSIYSCGYLGSALFLLIGRVLNVPFSTLFMMGRFGNLLVYSIITFFAIRHSNMGKRTMAFIALMPTPFIIACTYSYDATLISFAFLGISYILSEVFSQEKISKKNISIFLVSFFIVCLIKAVYAPMILLALLIPKENFITNKQRRIFDIIIISVALIMLSTFVLPALGSDPKIAGDVRGGDTSVGGQIRFILKNPLKYSILLLGSIMGNFISYSIGGNALSLMGHLGLGKFPNLIMVALTGIVLTEKNKTYYDKKHRIFVCSVLFIVICLIWTALYLSFTPVGSNVINGVQGRYFIPLLIPGLMIFSTKAISCSFDQLTYNAFVMTSGVLLFLFTIYPVILLRV